MSRRTIGVIESAKTEKYKLMLFGGIWEITAVFSTMPSLKE